MSDQCCYSSLDTSESGSMGYPSGTSYVVTDESTLLDASLTDSQIMAWSPTSATGMTYCYLALAVYPSPPAPTADLAGYQSLFYLSDGECYDGLVRCFANGTLLIYGASECSDTPVEAQLTSSAVVVSSSSYLGSFVAKLLTVSEGHQKMGWTTYNPDIYLIPNFQNKLEIVGTIFYAAALAGEVVTMTWTAIQYRKKPNPQLLFLLFSQTLWLCWISLRIGYVFSIFENNADLYMVQTPMNYMKSLATLSTTIYTTWFFNSVLKPAVWMSYCIYGFLFVAHLALNGSMYLWVSPATPNWIQGTWNGYNGYWIIVMFIWDIIPLNS
ncbi:hypothetical protein HDU91_004264 [Kappamyces sp. JEL0680]|nr:hypothetical protein HDU91_004264 [Kappamyces sp. JEL0680]